MTPENQWKLTEALSSYARLNTVLDSLSEDEVIAALELESRSRRRQSIIDRLISRAIRLNELQYSKQLKEKYHGTSVVESSDRR
jgi:hypothetical protein